MALIIGLILGGVAVIFILQNISPVTVMFLGWEGTGSLAVFILLALLAGMIISWLLSIPALLQLSNMTRKNRKLRGELDTHKEKLAETEGKLSQAEAPVVLEKTMVVEKE